VRRIPVVVEATAVAVVVVVVVVVVGGGGGIVAVVAAFSYSRSGGSFAIAGENERWHVIGE